MYHCSFYVLNALFTNLYKRNSIISFVDLKVEEYCLLDTFRPQCSSDEMILITHAHYGAMKIGKCIDTEIPGK